MSGRDVGASVRQRLLNQSRTQGRPFQELLQYFAMERFLYRLAQSPFADRFILKGALLLTAWRAPVSRPTIDIDLAGRTSNELDHIEELVGSVCDTVAEPDGIGFNRASIEVSRIKEDADYEGVRVKFHAVLAKARVPMQIDIGFGDIVVPGPTMVEYPTLLDFPPPVLQAYPRETVIAEKLEALTALGLLNSRMKDYYDLALLARTYSFEGAASDRVDCRHLPTSGTKIEAEPIGLTNAFYADPARTIQWRAFIRRSHFVEESGELERLVAEIRQFALPVLAMAADETPLKPAGSLAGRGNERVTSFTKVVWGSEMTDQVSDIGNPSYSRVHSGSGEAFCVCRGAESFTTFSTHAELPSVE